MSSHRRNYQCFNAVGGEGSHMPSLPFKHHTSRLPWINTHGILAHHEPLEECYLCSEHRHTQAVEALETHVSPLYHAHAPCHHHQPQQYVLRGPTRPEEHPVAHSGHVHHQRHSKRLVLVKNSDPSSRKTIALHRRSLHSFGLFIEEVSELMQYHVRKLYTLDGRKIDNVQSLMQSPSVLVCMGREPSHPSVVENFEKTSYDKLPDLHSHSSGCNGGRKNRRNIQYGLSTKQSANSQLESDNRSTGHSVTSDKSLPDGTDSPDKVDSCPHTGPHTGGGMREDDIEKRVRVNKDGSLSMEMKVCFRLQNDETLHWSTEVRKKTGTTCEFRHGHNDPYFAQVNEKSYSESENISASEQEEAYIARPCQKHAEEPHCPHCCRHGQEYDIWKNIPGTHGASRRIQTSSSSASSRTMVSRKTVVETSEDHTTERIEQVVETESCVEQTDEIVEYCTISDSCSPKCKVQSSTPDNREVSVDCSPKDEVDVKTAEIMEQEQQAGSVSSEHKRSLSALSKLKNEQQAACQQNQQSHMLLKFSQSKRLAVLMKEMIKRKQKKEHRVPLMQSLMKRQKEE
ncbi:retinitis pigmentosa 1-like 1 protein [Pseudochaenichthys georgianus]|uniref:retinitis pigmentosa 1-like 1 protein n=1 Tax=Pseudochaenichthys georgianus TaxID=52239 RepID=UPI0039C197CB